MTLEIYKTFTNGMRWSATTQVRGGGIIVSVDDVSKLSDSEIGQMVRAMIPTAELALACEHAYYLTSTHAPGRFWYVRVLEKLEGMSEAEELMRRYADQDEGISEALDMIAKARAEKQLREKGRSSSAQTRKEAKSRYDSLFMEVGRRDGFACATCGYAGNDLQLDHVVPVAKGGTNDLGNLQLLCPPCNLAKSDL